MSTISESFVDLPTSRGLMRVHVFTPNKSTPLPAVIFYSEIFQVTAPIRRTAAQLASEGYIVAVPEVYHEFEELGCVLGYDDAGSTRGNFLKFEKEIASYDEDTDVAVKYLLENEACNGNIASFGVCLGGHLAIRAGFHKDIKAVGAFYPTDVHTSTLGKDKCDDTLKKLPTMKASLLFVFGRQDPHVPLEGRRLLKSTIEDAELDFEWHEFNAAHAFMRDEGPRYNPALARSTMTLLHRFLAEKLA